MSLPPTKTIVRSTPHARTLLGGALILVACLLSYAPVLHGQFLWDDQYLVGTNPFFKSPRFVFEVFRHWLFIDSFSLYYRPVQNLSYMVDYAIWNQDSFGYHLSNVLFHAASAFLLMLVVRRCLRQESVPAGFAGGCAFFVGLLWAVHPIHNAAVAYVAGRADSIAMMFALAGWLLFLAEGPRWKRIVCITLAPLCILAALCAKEIAFIWIALFAIYLFGFERGIPLRAKLVAAGSLLGVFAIYLWLRHLPASRPAQEGMTAPPFPDRVMLMLRALGDYTTLIFYPGNLHMERTVWTPAAYHDLATWQQNLRGDYLSLIGLATIALFIVACWSRLPGRKIRILGVTWFVLGFLPISNLFPLNAQVAEHWIYMASAGYLLMLAGFVPAIPARYQRALAKAAPVVVVALGIRTAFRAADWADPERFFRQTIAAGGFPERVSLNLAQICVGKGEVKEAEAILRKTVHDYPDYPAARIQLGVNLLQQGKKIEAAQYLELNNHAADIAAKTTPQSWHAALSLASMQFDARQPALALATMDGAIKRYPEVWELVQYRADVLQDIKGPAAARPAVAEFAARNWWHMGARLTLARIETAAGDYTDAVADCRDAATLDIHNAAPFELAAKAEVQAHHLPQALAAQATAISRGPAQPDQYMMLAAILNAMHQPEKATAAVRIAQQLRASGTGG